jgi:enoyl-CoA hydratase/carnithine racemase
MEYREIRYDASDAVATITLNRPARLNAWTLRMGAEVRHAVLCAERDTAVRVIIVTGAGRAYCAGADMQLLQGLHGDGGALGGGDVPPMEELPREPDAPRTFTGEYSFPMGLSKPVIAAVNGDAAGLGLSYKLFYDMRIASERARFATVFAHRGLVAEHGSAWLLPRLVGTANACDLLFSGRMIDAAEALRMGLINRVVPHGSLMRSVRAQARELATRCSPRALRIMKRQIYEAYFTDLDTSIQVADREMAASFTTEDFAEGVASFVQKRPPRFSGR